MDAALDRSSRRLQLPGGHAPRAPLRAPGSAMGTSASSSTAFASCSRVARATMIAGSLLLVSALGDRGRRPRRSRRRRSPGAGRVHRPGLREARGRPGWVGGLASRGRYPGRLGEPPGSAGNSGTEANCVSCRLAALEEALEVATRLPAHFRAFPSPRTPGAPTPLHAPPQPPAAAHSAWCGAWPAVRGAEGWRRPPLCCSCSVMSGCYRSGRAVPVRAGRRGPGCVRAVHSPAGREAPPPPRLLGSGGSQFL